MEKARDKADDKDRRAMPAAQVFLNATLAPALDKRDHLVLPI